MKGRYCKSSVLSILLLYLSGGVLADSSADLDRMFESHLDRIEAPGFSVAVVKSGALVYQRGFGLASVDESRALTENSILAIGSLTKSMTALAIMQLQERGLLDIDDPVVKYLPWFEVADKAKSKLITLRMFLSNSSGLQAQFSTLIQNQSRRSDALELNVRAMSSYRMTREPGTSFEYLNEGWNTLGLIIEKLTGLTWSEYVAETIFQPLGMSRTSTIRAELEKMPVETGHYSGIQPIPGRFLHTRASLPAGSGTYSTASDLGRYMQLLLNHGTVGETTILSPEGVSTLFTPQVSMSQILSEELGGTGESGHYAFGWASLSLDGHPYISHGGEFRTMSSQMMLDPTNGNGVILLYNTGELDPYRSESYYRLSHNVLRLLRGLPESDFAKPTIADTSLNSFEPDRQQLDAYLGTYLAASGYRIDIQRGGSEGLLAVETEAIYYAEYDVDFVNSSNFVLRNIANHERGYFAKPQAGLVPSLNYKGQVYTRRRQLSGRYQEHIDPNTGLHFALPQGWQLGLANTGFVASSKANPNTSLEVHSLSVDTDNWIENYSKQLTARTTLPLSELVGGLVFQGKLIETAADAGPVAHYVLGTHLRDKRLVFILTTPRELLTTHLTRLVLPLLESLQYR